MIRYAMFSGVCYFVCFCPLISPTAQAKDYLLFYLGGQSNMDGYGYVKDLPEELRDPVPGVKIFHGNTGLDGTPADGRGVWSELGPGHGTGFRSDDKQNFLSNRFGAELTFGRRMRELHPDANIALIKYSKGGTAIDQRAAGTLGCWDPDFESGSGNGKGVNQYDHFLATIRNATAIDDIDGDGENDQLLPAGIVWMQGETDAYFSLEVAESYQTNLTRLMDLVRAALRHDDLPVVVGRIADSGRITGKRMMNFGDVVREAQMNFTKTDGRAALVTTTDGYEFSDDWHYDSPGYIDLGQQFANALVNVPLP